MFKATEPDGDSTEPASQPNSPGPRLSREARDAVSRKGIRVST